MANGVVIERGTSDIVTELSSANALAKPNEVPIDAALTHQAGAVVVLLLALLQSERLSSARAVEPARAHAFSA